VAVSTSLFTSGSSINPGSPAPLLAPPPTSGSPVFLTPKSHSWLPLLVLSLKISLSPAQMATSSCNEVKQLPRYCTKDVAYTQSGLHLEAWFTPLAMAYTQSGLHHQPWRTPKVVYTSRRGPHHQPWRTPKVIYTTRRSTSF